MVRWPPPNKAEGVVLGKLVAEQLGLSVGDNITLLIPGVGSGELPEARLREFTVAGLFEGRHPGP